MTENSNNTPAGLKSGDKIGRYEIREILGIGGQAVVYKCYDPELERFVAVKHIATHLIHDSGYLAQIRQNIRNLASLGSKSEAIVNVFDIIENPDGLFYVMEFVEGYTLETLIRQADGPVENKAVLLILFRLAAALHDIHSGGIVHRDMKPSNIILAEGLRPKIIDFGVAALAGGDASMPLATTKYIAPEIYSGAKVDTRADLYAVGFMAYEMLAGRKKFNEIFADILRDKHSETLRWMKWHGNKSVVAPELHLINPNVPENLSALIAKMIEKDPEKRFADAEEFGRAMRTDFSPKGRQTTSLSTDDATLPADEMELHTQTLVAVPEPDVSTKPPPPADETPTAPIPKGRITRRTKRVLLGVGIAAVVCMLIGGGFLIYLASQTAKARSQSADSTYSAGITFFRNREYAKAAEKFKILLSKHEGTIQSKKSRVLLPMCNEYLAIKNLEWDKAVAHENLAGDAIKTLQRKTSVDDKAFHDWLNKRVTDVENLSKARYSSRFFSEAMQEAQIEIERSQTKADFTNVLQELKRQLGDSSITLTPRQASEAKALLERIQSERLQHLFAAALRAGDMALQKGNLSDAETEYRNAHTMLTSGEEEVKYLPPEKKTAMLKKFDEKQKQLVNRQKNREVYDAIRVAEKAGDNTALIVALGNALKLTTLSKQERQQTVKRLNDIKISEKLALAKDCIAKKNTSAARDALEEVLKIDPNNNQAKELVVTLDNADRKAALIANGRTEAIQGNYAKALNFYQMAAKFGEDENITAQIIECQFNIVMANADKLQKQGKYDDAEEAYNQAATIKPADTAQVETRLILLKTQREYEDFVARGEAAIEEKKWTKAIEMFEEAKNIQDNTAIRSKIDLTNYQKNIALGKKALENHDFPTARWRFNMARKCKDTQEVRDLINKAGGDVDTNK